MCHACALLGPRARFDFGGKSVVLTMRLVCEFPGKQRSAVDVSVNSVEYINYFSTPFSQQASLLRAGFPLIEACRAH